MESQMIQRAKAGDTEALTYLVDQHKELAFNIALRMTKSSEDAKDIVQESFLKVLKNIDRFKEEAKFSTWLFRIVYNESLMLLRKQKNSSTFLDIRTVESVYVEGQEEDINAKEFNYTKLHIAIDQLNHNERTVIDLFYLGEMSIKDIRRITQMSASNIKVILHRARLKMYKILEDE